MYRLQEVSGGLSFKKDAQVSKIFRDNRKARLNILFHNPAFLPFESGFMIDDVINCGLLCKSFN